MPSAHSDLEKYLRELLAAVKTETALPGLAVAISIDGVDVTVSEGVLVADQRQPFSVDARFQLGCITKMLTGLVAAALIHEGTLHGATPISAYLSELRGCEFANRVTVNHLMSHTSGYQGLALGEPGVNYYYTWQKFLTFLQESPVLFEPGTVFNYEHTESVLLGEIIRCTTGTEIIPLFQEEIFDPLGLAVGQLAADQQTPALCVGDHVYDRGKQAYTQIKSIPFGPFWRASLSDLTASLGDMVKLAEAFIKLLDGRSAALSRMLAPKPVEHIIRQAISVPDMDGMGVPEQFPLTFGHGVADYGGPLYGHNGSARGQTCGLRFDPKHRIAVGVGLNAWQPHIRDYLISKVLAEVVGYRRPSRSVLPLSLPISAYIGRYVGARGIDILVTEAPHGLKASIGNQGQARRFEISLSENANGVLKPTSNTLHHRIGFFANPGGDVPCIMLGMSAFKKQYSGAPEAQCAL